MAMTMADNLIRKACDRCHAQKLSCKRTGEEACERCVRLKAECKSSPSLRYKKQQQQQQQPNQQTQQTQQSQQQGPNQQNQPQHFPSAEASQGAGRRSPKRRRTIEDEMNLVQPDTGPMIPPAGELASQNLGVVTQDSLLGLADFNFSIEQQQQPPPPPFFGPGPSEYLFSPGIPDRVDGFSPQGPFASFWSNRFIPSSTPFQDIPSNSPFISPTHQPVLSSVPLRKRTQVPSQRSASRSHSAARQGSKQIALRQQSRPAAHSTAAASAVHWMARFAEIHARLLELSASLPSPETTAQSPALGRPSDERFRQHGFPVDEVFGLTGHVADIFEELCTRSDSGAAEARVDSSDPGNSLFALSIYVRLLDVFQKIFSLVRRELAHAESHVEFQYWKLPDVSIGSIEVDSSPRFQMFLAVQVALQFLTRLRKSTGALHSSVLPGSNPQSAVPNGVSMFSGPVDDTILAIQNQEANLVGFLSDLRGELELFRDSVEYEDEEGA